MGSVLTVLDQHLKQRLVGAVVLVGIGIIVIPLLLGEPTGMVPESENKAYSGAYENSAAPIAISSGRQEKPALPPEAKALSGQVRENFPSAEEKTPLFPAAPPAPVPAKKPTNSTSPRSPPKAAGWLIQIGSFTHQKNALRMLDEAVSSGYRAFIEPVKKGADTIYKVRIGPEKDEQRAQALKAELERRLQTKAFILSPLEG